MLDTRAWDRVASETTKQFHAFCHYRDLLADRRSLDVAYRDHARRCCGRQVVRNHRAIPRWGTWSRTWGWVERVAAWDAEQDRIAREQVMNTQVAARVRHAGIARTNLHVLSFPAGAALAVLRDRNAFERLVADARASTRGFIALIQLVAWCGRVMPALVEVERLALGMSTDVLEIDDRRPRDTLANRIVSDPEAVELAIALLHKLAA